jgi:GMP synthase (glutamine-hydrolysing)
MPRVVVIQHTPVEGLGRIAPLLVERGLEHTLVAASDALPSDPLANAGALVVLGGPMGVYDADAYPRLAGELRLIEAAMTRAIPVLGICLGSQLLASVLGARVAPGPSKEIGWHDVTLSSAAAVDPLFAELPSRFSALHWHGDVFELPHGARHLAQSDLSPNQAFSAHDLAWGLLFHLEADLPQARAMCEAFDDEVAAVGLDGRTIVAETEAREAETAKLASRLFGRFFDRLPG